jgi:hypothetical protein
VSISNLVAQKVTPTDIPVVFTREDYSFKQFFVIILYMRNRVGHEDDPINHPRVNDNCMGIAR